MNEGEMKKMKAGEMIPEVEGTRPWGPRGKGSPSVSKGPKPPIQLLQLLKNSSKEVKRAHFRYILGPPGSHPGDGINGARRGRSLPVSPAMPIFREKFRLGAAKFGEVKGLSWTCYTRSKKDYWVSQNYPNI